MNICSILERRQIAAAVPGCEIEWIVDDETDVLDGDDNEVEELVNVVELVEQNEGASMMTAFNEERLVDWWPVGARGVAQQLKRKREKGARQEGELSGSESQGSGNGLKQSKDTKRARLEKVEKPQLFEMWLKMKKEQRQDRKLQELVDAFVLPEDIYQHFKEFVPADTCTFMRRLQYERECAERALAKCKSRSWLLRRSSLNRRRVVLRVPCELGLGDSLTFGADDSQRPTFYAFSYSTEPGHGIAHVLIMKWKNLWARCDCDDGVEIVPTHYSTSFIAVLDRLLESEDLRPDRMVHGYLSARS